ncbi:MAG: hypothetical protein LUG54_11010 [Clostridiales bacterium]|nr:hypothetical protein [Clostridiales bacterium]
MMNKLIFAREKVLQDLQRNIRKETHKEIFRRVDEIDAALDKNREKGETLTTIMTNINIVRPMSLILAQGLFK